MRLIIKPVIGKGFAGMLCLLEGPRTKEAVNQELTDSEQLQIMEAYAEAEDNLFLDWCDDDLPFEPED